MQTQCLLRGGAETVVELRVRFLHVTAREIGALAGEVYELPPQGEPSYAPVAALEVDGRRFLAWEEAQELEAAVPPTTIRALLDGVEIAFDATEIDEILTLRILTMTDDEKRDMAAVDPCARALLERTEGLTQTELNRLHGTLRSPRAIAGGVGAGLRVGDQVRLRPKQGGDVFDIVLRDQIAIVEAIERDFENRTHVAVTLRDDPGRDFGIDRMPGHRFFFDLAELEPLDQDASR